MRKALADLKDIDFALKGIFDRLEPQAKQLPQREARDEPTSILHVYVPTGVGVQLRREPRTGLPQVVTPMKDGPAYRARVQSGDLITRITWNTAPG